MFYPYRSLDHPLGFGRLLSGTFRGEAPFAAWIFGLTRRTIASRFKRRRHATVPFSEEDHGELAALKSGFGAGPSPVELCEFREFLARIEELGANGKTGLALLPYGRNSWLRSGSRSE